MRKEGLTTEAYEKIDAILNKFYPGEPPLPNPKKQKQDKSQLDLFEEEG